MNVKYDLMNNEYTQEFITSILKPSRSSHHSSEKTYQGTVIISHVKGVSEKFKCIGNRFNVRTIFKTKQTLHGTTNKTNKETKWSESASELYRPSHRRLLAK
jgi:hypothetical protein